MSWDRLRRSAAIGLCLGLCVFAFSAVYTCHRGKLEMGASDRSFHEGRLLESIQHARRAASLYVPGAPHVGLAYQRLQSIGRGAEIARDKSIASAAWRAARAAAVETGHGWVSRDVELQRANVALGRLSRTPAVAGTVPTSSPGAPGAGVLACAFLLSLGAAAWSIMRGMDKSGRWLIGRAVVPGGLAIVSAIAWGWALLLA